MAVGYIYILTNPSFPQYVKIGYADNVENRLAQLNRSECIPFAFRVYATYEVQSRLSDMKVHAIIDSEIIQILRNYIATIAPEEPKQIKSSNPEKPVIQNVIATVQPQPSSMKYVKDVSIPLSREDKENTRFSDPLSTIILRFFDCDNDLIGIFYGIVNRIFDEGITVRVTITDSSIVCKLPRGCSRFSIRFIDNQFILKFRHSQHHYNLSEKYDEEKIYKAAGTCKSYFQHNKSRKFDE